MPLSENFIENEANKELSVGKLRNSPLPMTKKLPTPLRQSGGSQEHRTCALSTCENITNGKGRASPRISPQWEIGSVGWKIHHFKFFKVR